MKCPEHPDVELQEIKTDDGRSKFVFICVECDKNNGWNLK